MAENIDDPTLKAIAKWRNHPSILAIASEYKNRASFFFNFVSKEYVLTEIKMLDVSKAIQESDIPVKIIKANENFFAEAICFYFNKSLEDGKFPNCLKLANITPVLIKRALASENNCRPVSILPAFSKIFERLLSRQLLDFFDNILPKFQYGFRKGYGTQHRKQRTKVDSFYSSWEAILSGVPQGSILGPLLFNIFMCDMFLILKGTYFTGYADDNTPFVVRDNIANVIKALEEIGESLVNWFSNNEMKLNTDKCHLLLNSQEPNTLKIGDLHINNSLSEKILGITFDCKLKFNKHIEDILQKHRRS